MSRSIIQSEFKDTMLSTQDNAIDGTIICYQPIPGEGVCVTLLDESGEARIVVFDLVDLNHLDAAGQAALAAGAESLSLIHI